MSEGYISRGAEAILYPEGDRLVKERVKKSYRLSEIDERIRKHRTQREAKIMRNARAFGLPVPEVFYVDLEGKKIYMEYLEGTLLKDSAASLEQSELLVLAEKIGSLLARMHEVNIVHNDLTSSNMILSGEDIYFIDFGLAVTSRRIEDKAMDLVVFKKALHATHPQIFSFFWDSVMKGYKAYSSASEVLGRVSAIEKRARYS